MTERSHISVQEGLRILRKYNSDLHVKVEGGHPIYPVKVLKVEVGVVSKDDMERLYDLGWMDDAKYWTTYEEKDLEITS
jgi:hypothetical protein